MIPRRKAPAAAALLLLLWGVGCGRCGKQETPPEAIARLVSFRGEVTLTRGGAAQPAQIGPLLAGDLVQTGAGSSAVLQSSDGRELELGENARFRVDVRMGRVTVNLQAGVISFVGGGEQSAPGRGKLSLAVLTPFGETQLSPGAKGRLTVGATGLGVDVAMGTITLVAEDGGSQTATAGQRLNVKMGFIEVVADLEADTDAGAAAPVTVTLEPIQVRLSAESGTPLLKRLGAKRFTPASKEAQPLEEGTAFKLPAGARARIDAEGVRVQLAGGDGTFEKSEREGGKRRYRVKLASGTAQAVFSAGDTALVVAGPRGEVELKANAEAAATVVQTPRGPRLDLQAGELEVTAGGQTRTVKAGEVAEMGGAGVQVTERAPPALMLPTERKLSVEAQGLSEVGLTWPQSTTGPAPAKIEVASDAAFTEVLLTAKTTGPYVVVSPPRSGALFWRVLDEAGQPLHTGRAKFEAELQRAGGTPRSDVAETGLKSTVFFQSALPTLTFTFPAREGARRYRMRVFRASNLTTPLVERDLSEPRCTVEAGTLIEGEYVWYAAPLDAAGGEQAGGRMNKLEITYDNSLTTLVISRPKQGEKVGPGPVEVEGVAPLRSRLFVGGKAVPLDEKGRFSTRVTRADELVFRLVAGDGEERFWTRRLVRAR